MTYRALVFFDLDGTLMNPQSQLDADVRAAVHSLRDQDILPVIATGRSRGEIPEIFEQAGIDTYVALNGGVIVYNGQPIYEGAIAPATIEKMLTVTESHGDALAYYNGTDFRISRLNDLVKAQYDFVSTPYPQVERDFYQTNPVDMLLVITVDNDKRYTYPYGDELTFYRNTPYALDTVLKGESKQFGIRTLIDKMGLADVPTYAFGDGVNDIPMLNTVDHPIAMGNGITAVKDRAEYITAKNTEGGIIQGLRHFELLP
ncbi:MAG: Cof-type HAD-IIB family hydrolase [Loigolactobacillus coryniformis]|jgi:Cof subfamily protein (haloacid dehalogenase superfamily)|uniref:Cof-like hydrolase family protein n=3 Tax=Loigolactobacillus coryniformis TaxID=1610 RepID=J3JBP5_9LACO|nr:Cof-type HAD-IIB family hydrolase [Loigolactobacillus coryniformis]MDN6334745.1 Cof-type HAD-IIB family hydrolase [Lacticaseibacillus paracasei]MDT3391795.1 Cof-type HAD-IIB family hydrolase [Bacillota bacterium]OEH90569.1 haloacid dehalogenase [Loigolactobacillus coryniformis subsp. coryniformis]RRG04863.1 MAG: Cof-type HAD-IIB family hydrolase [Lactobacillus sp.]ATO44254.1 haloacid dehalogenase [Loigolactobacillus coryniformis subsp. torquens DSM 20004 = KCTC 3535]